MEVIGHVGQRAQIEFPKKHENFQLGKVLNLLLTGTNYAAIL